MRARTRRDRLRRAARKIGYRQRSRARAAKSHRKRTPGRLQYSGIRLSQLRKCSRGDIAL